MERNYIFIVLVSVLFTTHVRAQEVQKDLINYQGVARSDEGQLMAEEDITLGIALKFGSANAGDQYKENHSVTTDANGVFSLKIGNGNTVAGDYNSLPWGNGATFMTVSINGSKIGTTEMMGVSYAIRSGDGDNQSADEVPYNNAVSGLMANTTLTAIEELATSGIVDGDTDPANEIQTISFDVGTNQLSLTDGGVVTIPNGGTDADADHTNEIQDLSLSGTELTISDGSTIDLAPIVPPGRTDDQNLILTCNVLTIENGSGSVDLSTYAGDDADGDPENEIDVTRRHGILVGDDGIVDGLVGTADGQVAKWDSALGNWVAGTDDIGGGAGGSLWNEIPAAGINYSAGFVGIETDVPTAKLDVKGDIRSRILSGTGERNVVADADGNLIIGACGGGSSLWTQDGSNINYVTGRVGIGSGSELPNAVLEVAGGATSKSILTVVDTELIGRNLAIDGRYSR